MDINSEGDRVVAIDGQGICTVSDLNKDICLFSTELKIFGIVSKPLSRFQLIFTSLESSNRCRWNPLADHPIVATVFSKNKLNFIDMEKGTAILRSVLELDNECMKKKVDLLSDRS